MSQVPGAPDGPPIGGSAEEFGAEAPAPPPPEVTVLDATGPDPATEPEPEAEPGYTSPPPDDATGRRPGIIEAVADLLQFIVDWLRQEAGAIMHDKIVIPGQKLGLTLASGCAAAFLAALGLGFISVGVFMLLGQWLTYAGALLLIGGVLVLGAIVFTVIKMRSMQK